MRSRKTRMSPEPAVDVPAEDAAEAADDGDVSPLLGDGQGSDPAPEPAQGPVRRVRAFYERLSTTFSWRYVAIVSLVYGFNQGVGEACLFTAQKYYLFDDLKLTPTRYSKVDGFANIPWQVKALFGMASDSFSICGLRKTPYIILASIGGIVSAASLWLAPIASYQSAALLLVLANLSIASPDVMIDGTTAENSRKHPHLAADLQTLSWSSLYACAMVANLAVGELVKPSSIGARGVFGLLWVTSLAALIPACLGWLGERPSVIEEASVKTKSDRKRVFACALATCTISVTVGSLQAFSTYSDLVQGVATIILGVALACTIHCLLKPVSKDLAGAAVYIFLSGALQPGTDVMFAWFHSDGKVDGNCSSRCPVHDKECGWAYERDYPCITPEYYAAMRSTARGFGLAGIVLYNAYFSDWKYRDVFVLGHSMTFAANLLDVVWVSRWNVALGVDDRAFLLGVDVVQPVIAKIAHLPSYVLAAKVCPAGVEATLFALLMGLSNFGSTIGLYNGVFLLSAFGGVEQPEFRNLPQYVLARTVSYLAPVALVFVFVPRGRPSDPTPEEADEKGEVELTAIEDVAIV